MMHSRHNEMREVKLFKNRQNQAVRIPVDFAFTVDRVRIRRKGEALLIDPIHDNGLAALLDRWQPLEDDFPDIADEIPVAEDVF